MKLSHQEKQKKRMELKLKGFTPEQVEKELSKILNNTMEENTPVAPEATLEVETPEIAPEGEPVVPEAPVDTPVEPVA